VPLPRGCDPRRDEVPAERYAELGRFSDTRTRAEIEAALRIVDPHGALAPYLTLTDAALEVRLAAGDRAPAARVGLRAAPAPARSWPRRRIALDPGHWGGAWSRIEKRHWSRDGGPVVREGDLAWATARLLERDLAAAGMEVRLLRGPPPVAAFPAGADPRFDLGHEAGLWLAEQPGTDPPWLAPLWSVRLWQQARRFARDNTFELHNRHDLRRRAAAAAEMAPDVTLSLHYDFTTSDTNGVLVFVPGSYMPDELVTASQRFWALRRVVDGTVDENHRLARAMADALMRRFELPALYAEQVGETATDWLPVDRQRGVYARNLAISRRTPGVVLLLEGPCVNEAREYRRLLGTEIEVDGRRYPARVRQYADGVLEALRAQ